MSCKVPYRTELSMRVPSIFRRASICRIAGHSLKRWETLRVVARNAEPATGATDFGGSKNK